MTTLCTRQTDRQTDRRTERREATLDGSVYGPATHNTCIAFDDKCFRRSALLWLYSTTLYCNCVEWFRVQLYTSTQTAFISM